MSRQWILLPDEIAKLKETRATVFGFGIPKGGSREARKSDTCVKWMNCVACGSYLNNRLNKTINFNQSSDNIFNNILIIGLVLTLTIEYRTSQDRPRQFRSPLPGAPD